jgi:DNA-binding NarL/FixJ family response regulator
VPVSPRKAPVSEREWTRLKENLALSSRQAEILYGILHAKSDREIADELEITVTTVRTYLTRMFHKYGVNDRVGLVVHAFASLRHGSDTV